MKDNPKAPQNAGICSNPLAITVTLLNALLFAASLMIWLTNQDSAPTTLQFYKPDKPIPLVAKEARAVHDAVVVEDNFVEVCDDLVWCSIAMPNVSYFHFDPPSDLKRWRHAQLQAMRGEQVLLKHALKAFPTHLDFLDGDIAFRKMHLAMDMFVDERRDLSPLIGNKKPAPLNDDEKSPPAGRRRLAVRKRAAPAAVSNTEESSPAITAAKRVNGQLMYPWELAGRRAVPEPYDFRRAERAPVISIGYTAFTRDSQTYFSGNRVGGAFIDRSVFFRHWRKVMQRIDTPFIAVCALNENWGFLSTNFPNRTAGWGRCCDTPRDKIVYDFLNHEKTLLLVTNQHANVSHPKLMIWPRGIPVTWGTTRMMIWDTMRKVSHHNAIDSKQNRKEILFFAASSTWGPRPQILRCISNKFTPKDFDGHTDGPKAPRLDRIAYYEKMTTAMFGLGLPGLGYDCFRNWELMAMGTIVVLEKGVGLDRTVRLRCPC